MIIDANPVVSGLKNYNVDLSAIVSMSDDGGSTGILRDELGVLGAEVEDEDFFVHVKAWEE